MAQRTWTVESSSFGPSFVITGETLPLAVRSGLKNIVLDAFRGRVPESRIVSLRARWEDDILDGVGGVELTMETISPGRPKTETPSSHVTWIRAVPDDMPDPVSFPIAS